MEGNLLTTDSGIRAIKNIALVLLQDGIYYRRKGKNSSSQLTVERTKNIYKELPYYVVKESVSK